MISDFSAVSRGIAAAFRQVRSFDSGDFVSLGDKAHTDNNIV